MQGAARHQWRFSLSHSGDLVYVAIAQALRVGVDVEQVRPALDWEAAGELCLEPVERQQLMRIPASDRCAAFHRIWCRKEALAKAAGKSMHVPLDRPAGGWNLTELQAPPGYMAALAVECPL
jgi:4'-phosphopantetheinyl transferase